MQNIMVDLETCGTLYNAPVLAIGACYFDPATSEIGQTFYEAIGPSSAFMHGRPSGDTFKWWMQQSDEARQAVISGTMRTEDVLPRFRQFCMLGGPQVKVWGNGATFDISIMDYLFRKVEDRDPPWKFWNVRDCRTVKDMVDAADFKSQVERGGTHHQALDDAIFQAKWVSEGWQVLTGVRKVAAVPAFVDPFA